MHIVPYTLTLIRHSALSILNISFPLHTDKLIALYQQHAERYASLEVKGRRLGLLCELVRTIDPRLIAIVLVKLDLVKTLFSIDRRTR